MEKRAKSMDILQQTLVFPGKDKILEALGTQIGPNEKAIVAIS